MLDLQHRVKQYRSICGEFGKNTGTYAVKCCVCLCCVAARLNLAHLCLLAEPNQHRIGLLFTITHSHDSSVSYQEAYDC